MPEVAAFEPVRLVDRRGTVEGRLFAGERAESGVILVGGVGGGFDSPARDLYGHLARHLPADGVAVLRVRFRSPGDLGDATDDVRAGISFLAGRGVGPVALVGHSFGGAVVIRAALASPRVTGVVALSTQSFGTEGVGELHRPLLLVHGAEDEVLPAVCSVDVHRRAPDAELRVLPGAGHVLDEAADEVHAVVHGWLRERLRAGAAEGV